MTCSGDEAWGNTEYGDEVRAFKQISMDYSTPIHSFLAFYHVLRTPSSKMSCTCGCSQEDTPAMRGDSQQSPKFTALCAMIQKCPGAWGYSKMGKSSVPRKTQELARGNTGRESTTGREGSVGGRNDMHKAGEGSKVPRKGATRRNRDGG